MSSLPKCLQNPTLRSVYVGKTHVTLDRVAPKSYDIYIAGVLVGHVHKLGSVWRSAYPTKFRTESLARKDVIEIIVNDYVIGVRPGQDSENTK